MFVTQPSFQQDMPAPLVAPGQKYWLATTLSLESPWYLLVYEVSCDGQKLSQTSLVAWESMLLAMLAEIPVADVTGIARLEKRRDALRPWELMWIDSLWEPSPGEAEGVLLMRLVSDTQLRDAHSRPVSDAKGRRLLYQAST